MRAIKISLALVVLAAAAFGGFYWGRALGTRSHESRSTRGISSLLPFHSSFAGGIGDQEPNPNVPPDQVFEDVLDKVQHEFVDGGGTNARLSNAALSRMLASLDDPKTSYLEPPIRAARQDALKGRYHGIGAVLTEVKSKKDGVDYRHLTVVDVMPGSPAEKAGLHPRDVITHIDDRWVITYAITVEADRISKSTNDDELRAQQIKEVNARFQKGVPMSKAVSLLSTGESKTLKLTVVHSGLVNPVSHSLKTALTEVGPVEFRILSGHIAYLRVRQFNARATKEFQAALDNINSSENQRLKGLIIDLRDNPGGVRADTLAEIDGFTSSRKLMARLTKGGAVATLERHANVREPLVITGAKPAITLPRLVLVDQGTANLSEMVAAALRDSGAKIMGSHTFGDDVLQLFTAFKSGAGVEMTTAHLLTTGGTDLNKGIEPDFPLPGGEAASDGVVKIALLKLGTKS